MLYPWAGFAPEQACVVVLEAATEAPTVASRLLVQEGVVVATAFSVADHAPTQCRVKPQPLKWIKDSDFAKEVSSIVDQMPGLFRKRNPAVTEEHVCTPLSFVAYDPAFDVPRQLLSWGFLAAWVQKNSTQEEVDRAPEPLKSYMKALGASMASRFATEDGSPHAMHHLEYNTAPKMTPAQYDHALRVFYWAAIHADDETRPITKNDARHILDVYLTCGTVFLKKRAYNFQGVGKRARRRADDLEDVDE
jgi:hypothetical protein